MHLQNRSANVNRGANVNHNTNANVNRNVNVNQNVNVNRNVNVNVNNHGGCYNCGYYHDNDWNWGSFAAGAAVGVATTAVIASATSHPTQTVVCNGACNRHHGPNSARTVHFGQHTERRHLQLQQCLLPSLLSGHKSGLSGCHLPVGRSSSSSQKLEDELKDVLERHNREQKRDHRKQACSHQMKDRARIDGQSLHLLNHAVAVPEVSQGLDIR